MTDEFIFRGSLSDLDPEMNRLLEREDHRQRSTIILIPSESIAPDVVAQAMSSSFGNIYAEGYPRERSRLQTQDEIMDLDLELAHYRRHSDPRYYKGVEYADVLEALTRRRAAELFAANGVLPEQLYVNVQALSGAPANSAIYHALMKPGDTLMGLKLSDGGHLSHGAPVSRTGQVYNSVNYMVDPTTERLDYDAIEKLALESRPNVIVAGFSAYPLIVDWQRFRAIADQVGAYLHADIAHISGLVAAGVHPSPVGIADTVMTTTHKSLCGPRGALILTHRKELGLEIDKAVFPGEQGGPHLNTMAALAVALKLARSQQFKALQQRIVDNATRLADALKRRGLRLMADGSENHLLMIDVSQVKSSGVALNGDMAARILDAAGIVTNRNTIPGDRSAVNPSGVRIGTVWISQLGYGSQEIDVLAEALAELILGSQPFEYSGPVRRRERRAKVSPSALDSTRQLVRQLTGQPLEPHVTAVHDTYRLRGSDAANFLELALAGDVISQEEGEIRGNMLLHQGKPYSVTVRRESADVFTLRFPTAAEAYQATAFFRDLSDGYLQLEDVYAKLPGPVVVEALETVDLPLASAETTLPGSHKPYFVGHQTRQGSQQVDVDTVAPKPAFTWTEPAEGAIRHTALHDAHVTLGAKMIPFGGWDMPVWYSSVGEEHRAVRESAGLFDVSHMGVLEASGPLAESFLNMVTTNDVSRLSVGRSHYTYLLYPDGRVVDDLLVYRRAEDRFMLVVNAANNDKDWAWLNAVNSSQAIIDQTRPWLANPYVAELRDLRDPRHGADCRVDIALQGPRSRDILQSLVTDDDLASRLKHLPWTGLTEGRLAGFDVIVSRTGYTGERIAYELFVHPDDSPTLWQALLSAGEAYGLQPVGLAARDSTRTEAGLPLYGHELAGPLDLDPDTACFGNYVKLWKPFFIGRQAFIEHHERRDHTVVRFRMEDKGVRRPELGDPVLDKRGKVIGTVTSCAIDREGYLLGLAVVPWEYRRTRSSIFIYQTGGGQRPLRLPASIKPGTRMPIPDKAMVVTRFPRR